MRSLLSPGFAWLVCMFAFSCKFLVFVQCFLSPNFWIHLAGIFLRDCRFCFLVSFQKTYKSFSNKTLAINPDLWNSTAKNMIPKILGQVFCLKDIQLTCCLLLSTFRWAPHQLGSHAWSSHETLGDAIHGNNIWLNKVCPLQKLLSKIKKTPSRWSSKLQGSTWSSYS